VDSIIPGIAGGLLRLGSIYRELFVVARAVGAEALALCYASALDI
jgi:hypothetical protein